MIIVDNRYADKPAPWTIDQCREIAAEADLGIACNGNPVAAGILNVSIGRPLSAGRRVHL